MLENKLLLKNARKIHLYLFLFVLIMPVLILMSKNIILGNSKALDNGDVDLVFIPIILFIVEIALLCCAFISDDRVKFNKNEIKTDKEVIKLDEITEIYRSVYDFINPKNNQNLKNGLDDELISKITYLNSTIASMSNNLGGDKIIMFVPNSNEDYLQLKYYFLEKLDTDLDNVGLKLFYTNLEFI